MKIAEYIQNNILLSRLRQAEILVVYDPARRYRALCQELAAEHDDIQLIDATENSILSREQALATFQRMGKRGEKPIRMLIYVPADVPRTDEAKQQDPFSPYAVAGDYFPRTSADDFQQICLRAKPDFATEIRQVFERFRKQGQEPDFAVIDAIGAGPGWPILQELLHTQSAQDIILALLAPNPQQKAALESNASWLAEARDLLDRTLRYKLPDSARTQEEIATGLWRYMLFSEFAEDLPQSLPQALAQAPRAPGEAMPLIFSLCDRLRNDQRTLDEYIRRAEEVQEALQLDRACAGIEDFGTRATFPLEERKFFERAVRALLDEDIEEARRTIEETNTSIWMERGEIRIRWNIPKAALRLLMLCSDVQPKLDEHLKSQDDLLDFYLTTLYRIDWRHREFEQAVAEFMPDDETEAVDELIQKMRRLYREITGRAHEAFIRHLEKRGWPPQGRLYNVDLFDKIVASRLRESGHRVAYFLIDAFRYELGMLLHQELADSFQVELKDAYAALPSVTPVGMAGLLPGAGHELKLIREGNRYVPMLGETPVKNVNQRMAVFRNRYGERFYEIGLGKLARSSKKKLESEISGQVDLLVVRSNEMDEVFENNIETALSSALGDTFRQIKTALKKLESLGFKEVIIATDHGFYLSLGREAGDVGVRPPGQWVDIHNRFLLGDGRKDSANFVLPAGDLGIRGDFPKAGGPRALVAYQAGVSYFHGGASLHETIVPVLIIQLKQVEKAPQIQVELTYRRNATRVTTRRPVLTITVNAGDLWSFDTPIQVQVLAFAYQSTKVIGRLVPGDRVDATSRTLTITPGETLKIPLELQEGFEGKFTVKAMDPVTQTVYASLHLETDFLI